MTTQLKFTSEIQKELNYERYHYPAPLVMRRMEVLWLKSQGLAHEQIATLAGISENTMREYFSLYEEGGVEKLKELNYYHPESAMNEHITSLEAYFLEHPPASIKEAQQKIKDITGIERSETQVRVFLKKNLICVAGKLG
jgi:transposase